MKPALRLLATLVLLLQLGVPAKAQVSLFGFNWSMTPSEPVKALYEGYQEEMQPYYEEVRENLVSEAINTLDDMVMACADDFERFRERAMELGVEIEACEYEKLATLVKAIFSELASNSNNSAEVLAGEIMTKVIERHVTGTSIEDLVASTDIFEPVSSMIDQVWSETMDTDILFSDGGTPSGTPPLGTGFVPFLWACAGERDYEWALNYKGLEGRFCGEGEDRLRYNDDLRNLEWISNEFSEPWIAFNCTKFDGCGLDDIYIADLLFEDPDIEDQLSPQRGGLRFDIDDFGLCRRAISGERLCVLNSHIILFKGGYQQGQIRQRLTLN